MRVSHLIEYLKMLPDDVQVYIQTVPDDFASPLEQKHMKLWPAFIDEKYKSLEREKLVLTSLFPEKK